MNKKIISKVVMVAVVVCILASLIIIPTGCSSGKKAIIILPGIMGSNIIDAENGDPLWAPLEKGLSMWDKNLITKLLMKDEVYDILDLDGPKGGYQWLDKMKINPDGTPNHSCTAQVINDEGVAQYDRCSTYGTLDYYKKLYEFLKDNFADDYDVRMFEYDWRLNNMDSAAALEKFIKDHKYKDVVLVAHSMGGVLASTYIARSPKNAKKVSKFISLGTPFLGAHKAIRVAEDPLSLVGDNQDLLNKAKDLVDSNNEPGAFDKFFDKFLDFVHDLPTIYQLIPYAGMCEGYNKDGSALKGHGIVEIDGEPITNYDDYMSFLKQRGWINERCVNNMIEWQKEQYVDGEHASMKVDTSFVVGTNLETECGVYYKDGKMTESLYTNEGDGTVPLYSATCGLPMSDPRIVDCGPVSHGDLAYDDTALAKIKEIILNIK